MEHKTYEIEWAGRPLKVEVGHIAQQTNGTVLVTYGDTVVLGTAVMNKEPREGTSFFPLMVDFEEKMYAAGRIKGSRFIKRETKPTDEAVLTARLIDRGLRPLFDERIRNDIQVIVTALAVDGENDPDVPAMFAAALALHISDIPWNGPLVGIRVGKIAGEWVLNPTYTARDKADYDLTVCFHDDKVVNVEAGCNETPEEEIFAAFQFASKHVKKVVEFMNQIQKEVGKTKLAIPYAEAGDELLDENQKLSLKELDNLINETKEYAISKLDQYLFNIPRGSKRERKTIVYKLKEELITWLNEKQVGKDRMKKVLEFFDDFIEEEVSRAIIEREQRVDGRKLTDIRSLSAEVGILKRTHGSAIFTRGETQILSVVTLGAPGDEQSLDGMEIVGKKRYMHHYNFLPFSVGEAFPLRGAGRREVGHGALAEKALLPVLPDKETFPYTIRVVSETLSSNGSSSMASTCGSTLSLMDAGVPIKRPVAGIAMGMASDKKGNYKILTDLQDLEDGQGGMDFKIAGTSEGITAIQMDTKTHGITLDMVKETLLQGKEARLRILDVMTKAIPAPRADLSEFAPRIISLHINPDKIRDVIGPGGKMINKIIDETGVQIDIEDSGLVMITGTNAEGSAKALQWIKDLTQEAEVGKIYTGTVVRLMDFGAFVEIFPGQDGMVHVSEITDKERVNDIGKYLKVGQTVTVKVMKIDEQGRVNLSIKRVADKE